MFFDKYLDGWRCYNCTYCGDKLTGKTCYCEELKTNLSINQLKQPIDVKFWSSGTCPHDDSISVNCVSKDGFRQELERYYILTALKTILNISSDDYVISNITNLITRMRMKEAVKSPENSNTIAYDILGQTFANNMKMHFSNVVNKHNGLEGNNELSAEEIHYSDNINIPDEAYTLATYVYNKLEPIARKYEQATLDCNEYLKDEATNDYLDTIFDLYNEIKFTKQEEESKDLEIINYINNKNKKEKEKNKQKILLPIGDNNKNN